MNIYSKQNHVQEKTKANQKKTRQAKQNISKICTTFIGLSFFLSGTLLNLEKGMVDNTRLNKDKDKEHLLNLNLLLQDKLDKLKGTQDTQTSFIHSQAPNTKYCF
jgi:hypothetical protein